MLKLYGRKHPRAAFISGNKYKPRVSSEKTVQDKISSSLACVKIGSRLGIIAAEKDSERKEECAGTISYFFL